MSYNRFQALSSSDSESLGSPSDTPKSVLEYGNQKKRQEKMAKMISEQENDEKDFDPWLLSRLRKFKWRMYDGEKIDKEVLKKYLHEIKESEGFDIDHFPGYIRCITCIRPHFDISQDYSKMVEMATTALKTFNKEHNQSKYKVWEIKKVNSKNGGNGRYYYITFSAVNVKGLNASLQSKIFDVLVAMRTFLMIVMVAFLVLFGVVLPPYNQTIRNLKRFLLKLKSGPELKASESEISEVAESDYTTFQTKVWNDNIYIKRKILLCRARLG